MTDPSEHSELSAAEATSGGRTCPNCGRELEAGFTFCDGCGTRLEAQDPEAGPGETAGTSEPATEGRPATEEGRGRRPVIGGWLRGAPQDRRVTSSEEETTKPASPARPSPPPAAPAEPAPFGVADIALYVAHIVVEFLVGALIVLLVGAAATLIADTSVLEMRGVPVFVGVAASIAVFALLRGRRRPEGARDWIMVGIGFLALVVAGAGLYRPAVMDDAQARIDRVLGVWSDADGAAVEGFEAAVRSWNETTLAYTRSVSQVLDGNLEAEAFAGQATTAEEALQEQIAEMRRQAASAENGDLEGALDALADTYRDQLAGLRLVTEGLTTGDFSLLERGDTAYKSARATADEVFEDRVRPILVDADVDASALDRAISA